MCGIAGFIGQSKNPKVTYSLITKIFKNLEARGTDAAGIWGVENKEKARIVYHKEPIKSSEFVKKPIWSKVQSLQPNLLLVHARRTSPGVGSAYFNKNNHPFVSEDRRIGIIHNGKIHEASFLSKKYETQTDCDSEIILRMYENAIANEEPLDIKDIPEFLNQRLPSVKELWSVLQQGSCAVMAGELHQDGSRSLIVFRNEKRPLWMIDLRETLGQIIFFSSLDIWHLALDDFKYHKILGAQKLVELPVNEVWGFKIDNDNKIVTNENFHRIKMTVDKSESSEWSTTDAKISIAPKQMKLSIVSDLDEKGDPPKKKYSSTYYGGGAGYSQGYSNGAGGYYQRDHRPPTGASTGASAVVSSSTPKAGSPSSNLSSNTATKNSQQKLIEHKPVTSFPHDVYEDVWCKDLDKWEKYCNDNTPVDDDDDCGNIGEGTSISKVCGNPYAAVVSALEENTSLASRYHYFNDDNDHFTLSLDDDEDENFCTESLEIIEDDDGVVVEFDPDDDNLVDDILILDDIDDDDDDDDDNDDDEDTEIIRADDVWEMYDEGEFTTPESVKMIRDSVEQQCDSIRYLLQEIETNFTNMSLEGCVSMDMFNDLMTSLEQTYQDLSGTSLILK